MGEGLLVSRVWKCPSSAIITKPGEVLPSSRCYDINQLEEFLTTTARLPSKSRGVFLSPRFSSYYFDLLNPADFKKIDRALDQLRVVKGLKVKRIDDTQGRGMYGFTVDAPQDHPLAVPLAHYTRATYNNIFTTFLGLGEDNNPATLDLLKCPHILVAGSSGGGKSTAINTMLCSLLLRADPGHLKIALIDPKLVEFAPYENLPHLLRGHIINTTEEAIEMFKYLVEYMDSKYKELRSKGLKSINDQPLKDQQHILVIVDEFADLILADPTLEEVVVRVAQKGRASGVHLLLATQRPVVRVISGLIKANITTRLCLKCASVVDSVNILDHKGGEQLLGNGDAILKRADTTHEERIQVARTTDEEIKKIVQWWKDQADDPEGFDPSKYTL